MKSLCRRSPLAPNSVALATNRPPWILTIVLLLTASMLATTACKGPGGEPRGGASSAGAGLAPSSDDRLRVSRIAVRDLTVEAERGDFSLPDLRQVLAKGLPAGSLLRFPDAAAPAGRREEGGNALHVAVLYGLISAEGRSLKVAEKGARLTAGVQLHLTLLTPGEPAAILRSERIGEETLPGIEPAQVHEATAALLRRLALSALNALDQRVSIHQGDEASALLGLDARDPGIQAYAIEQVGERGYRGATPQLLKLLDSEDGELRLRAIGALGLLKASEATSRLAALAGGNEHPREIAAAIHALADIGTPDARRYLKSVRDTSLFDDVKRLVDEALAR